MNDSHHLGDDAEAYALGMLERDSRDAVDSHTATCATCATRLGEAERAVATMFDLALPTLETDRTPLVPESKFTSDRRAKRYAPQALVALVAASLIGFLTIRDATLESAVRDDGVFVHAMVASHFAHAAFLAPDGRTLDAKVVYDRHGRWYDVIATDATWRVAIVARGARTARVLDDRFSLRGAAAVLRIPTSEPLDALELRDAGGGAIGRATIVLER